jgi:hypothetical protein
VALGNGTGVGDGSAGGDTLGTDGAGDGAPDAPGTAVCGDDLDADGNSVARPVGGEALGTDGNVVGPVGDAVGATDADVCATTATVVSPDWSWGATIPAFAARAQLSPPIKIPGPMNAFIVGDVAGEVGCHAAYGGPRVDGGIR